jgi:hypothetical protein
MLTCSTAVNPIQECLSKSLRDNANLLILFPQDELNLKRIFENHVGGDMEFSDFTALCRSCWNRPFSFLTIDKTLKKERYKRIFNCI